MTTDTDRDQEVLIVGGGIGGVSTAIALRMAGAAVTLVERAPEFGEVGAGLQLAPNATRILRAWGVLDAVRGISVAPANLVFRDAVTGKDLIRRSTASLEEQYGAPYLVAHRADLHTILVERARELGVRLINGVVAQAVETDPETGRATTICEEHRFESDVVIAADGLQSVLRKQISDDEVHGSHYVAYRGALPIDQVKQEGDLDSVVAWLGPECHLVQYPLRRGEFFNTVAVFRSESFAQGKEEFGTVEELRKAYLECVPEVQGALDNLWHGIRWPMYDRLPISQWRDGRMVLLGDAAHPMLQYLAQGACQAIEDAFTLAELAAAAVYSGNKANPGAWDAVIDEFVGLRAERTGRVQSTARVWGESWHVKSGIAQTLRNLLFGRYTEKDVDYTDWLYADRSAELEQAKQRVTSGPASA